MVSSIFVILSLKLCKDPWETQQFISWNSSMNSCKYSCEAHAYDWGVRGGGVLLNLFEVRRLKQKKISALWPLVSPHYFQELIKDHLGLQTSNCTCISDEAFLINCVSFLFPMLVNLSHFTFFTRDGYCWANFNQIYQCVLK